MLHTQFVRLLLIVVVALWAQVGAVAFAQEGVAGDFASDPEYRLNPEDVLEISVWREPELLREVLVRPDGGISFPLAGNIQAAGKTVEEVRRDLTREIREYIPDAEVSVSIKQVAGYRIYVLGQVNAPGQYTVGRYVDVAQALSLAGGLTPYADTNSINVIRRTESGEEVFPFSYAAMQRGRGLDQNIQLQSGDVVVVP